MWIKNFRHKKVQTVLIFFIILLCGLLLNLSASILTSLEEPFQKLAKECESATMVVYPYVKTKEVSEGMKKEFEKIDLVDRVELLNYHYISEDIYCNNKKPNAFMDLAEYNPNIFKHIRYIEGDSNIMNHLKENECIIPACISLNCNIKVGDQVYIKFSDGEIAYKVKAIYAETYSASATYDSRMIIKKLPKNVTKETLLCIYGKKGVTGKQIEEAYRAKNEGQLNGVCDTLEASISNTLLADKIVGGILLAMGFIMLIVSCLIIHFMMRNTMITDAKKIAIYKTIGYSNGHILFIYMGFYFVVTLTATIAGVIGSKFMTDRVLESMFASIGEVANSNVWKSGFACILGIMGLVLLVIYFIMRKSKNIKPVLALNGIEEVSLKKNHSENKNIKIQFSSFGIAIRTLMRNKKGAIGILITTIGTIFAINFAIISLDVANTMKDNNDFWLGVDACDVMESIVDGADANLEKNIIEQDSRVEKVLKSNMSRRVTLEWKKGMDATVMYAFVYDDYDNVTLPVVEGRNPEAENEIAIGSVIANMMHKEVGDYISCSLDGVKPVTLLITGIYQTYFNMGHSCRVTSECFSKNGLEVTYDHLSIYLKSKTNQSQFIADIKEKLDPSSNIYPRTEAFVSIMDMIAGPQQKAIPAVCVLVLLIGVISIFCIVLLKNVSSEKMNGIYKCLGYSTRHLILANIWFVVLISVVAIAISVPSILISYPYIMKASLSMFGMRKYPVNYNIVHLLITNISIIGIFILGTIGSSGSLYRVNVRNLVQE